jgi:hypothetical protein
MAAKSQVKVTKLTSGSGTFSKQPWAQAIRLVLIGGGGSGGGGDKNASNLNGAGGGAGGGAGVIDITLPASRFNSGGES